VVEVDGLVVPLPGLGVGLLQGLLGLPAVSLSVRISMERRHATRLGKRRKRCSGPGRTGARRPGAGSMPVVRVRGLTGAHSDGGRNALDGARSRSCGTALGVGAGQQGLPGDAGGPRRPRSWRRCARDHEDPATCPGRQAAAVAGRQPEPGDRRSGGASWSSSPCPAPAMRQVGHRGRSATSTPGPPVVSAAKGIEEGTPHVHGRGAGGRAARWPCTPTSPTSAARPSRRRSCSRCPPPSPSPAAGTG
jgi:hypothetical protein